MITAMTIKWMMGAMIAAGVAQEIAQHVMIF